MAADQQLIAVRIKDGIFVGNVTAAHDEDFLFMNKVTHIVNCAGGEVHDLFADSGIQYLTFPWKDTPGVVNTSVMFDSADRNIEQAVRFIDKGLENGDCVLVHSVYGVSRSAALVAAYFMVKYGWKVDNALSFLTMAHQEMNIKPHFLRQLRMFAKRHDTTIDVFDVDVDDTAFALDNDQWMLRNTLLNGLTADVQARNELYRDCVDRVTIPELLYRNPSKRRRRLSFVDTQQGTGVHSPATTPVVAAKGTASHVDPFGGIAGGEFIGAVGAQAIRCATKSKEPLSARRASPNTRSLESRPEVNAKGRQVLPLRPAAVAAVPPPPETAPPQDSATTQQQQQRAAMVGSFSSFEAARRPSAVVPSTSASAPGAAAHVIRSPFAISSSQAPRNGSPLPQRGGANRLSTQASADSGARGTTASQPLRQGTAPAPPPAVQELRTNTTTAPQTLSQAYAVQPLPRASSPASHPMAALPVSTGMSAGTRRNSSPVGRQPLFTSAQSMTTQLMANRASSPRALPQQQHLPQHNAMPSGYAQSLQVPGNGSVPPPASSGSNLYRRPSSPLPRQSTTMTGHGGGGGVTSAQQHLSMRGPTMGSSSSTLQQQRALSPTGRLQHPPVQPHPMHVQALPRASSPQARSAAQPVARTSSPMGSPVRTSSPMRASLADQYLGLATALPRTSSASGPTSSTILRRPQPAAVVARRM